MDIQTRSKLVEIAKNLIDFQGENAILTSFNEDTEWAKVYFPSDNTHLVVKMDIDEVLDLSSLPRPTKKDHWEMAKLLTPGIVDDDLYEEVLDALKGGS